MIENPLKTMEGLVALIDQREDELTAMKRTVNSLCEMVKLPPRYTETQAASSKPSLDSVRSDQFHGRPLATVITEYMEMRRAANLSPAKVAEIYEALVTGGYVFETRNADNAKRILRISLSKNPKFYRLPGGEYGLREWYPAVKAGKDAEEDSEE